MTTPPNGFAEAWSEAQAPSYRLLARFGITPASSACEILDVSFDLTPADLRDKALVEAWESLRSARGRLLVDFLSLDLPAEPASVPLPEGKHLPPMPWALVSQWSALASEGCPIDTIRTSTVVEMPAALCHPPVVASARISQMEDKSGRD